MTEKLCPLCGKPMIEAPKWPGMWSCPDYREPINAAPPYEYKCTGSELTEAGAEAFDRELWRLHVQRN